MNAFVDWKTWLAPAASILAVVVTNWLATRRFERERRHQRDDRLRELYARWLDGTAAWLNYAAGHGDFKSIEHVSLLRLQLDLLEDDPKAAKLIGAVWASIPEDFTADREELRMMASGGFPWEWPGYDKAVTELTDYLKSRKM